MDKAGALQGSGIIAKKRVFHARKFQPLDMMSCDEANPSTEEETAGESPWLSGAHVHTRRGQGAEGAAPQGAQGVGSLGTSLAFLTTCLTGEAQGPSFEAGGFRSFHPWGPQTGLAITGPVRTR